ncbi:uncharacterized protein METZ01_LOCUS343514, partial [marine metagenome]
LNAHLLEDIGYGKNGRKAVVETIGDFLYRIPAYQEALGSYKPQGNSVILAKVDELLVDDCNLAREYHGKRKGKQPQNRKIRGGNELCSFLTSTLNIFSSINSEKREKWFVL